MERAMLGVSLRDRIRTKCDLELFKEDVSKLCDMSAADERYVCDLRRLMRARLLCGLYSRRAVPPRWRRLAQAYCLTLTAVFVFITYFLMTTFYMNTLNRILFISAFLQFFFAQVVSLWSGDEYIYTFFTHNRMTDVTLDSSLVFNSLQKQLMQALIYNSVYIFSFAGIYCWSILNQMEIRKAIIAICGTTLLELLHSYSFSGKFLVLSLFNTRMLVLKRRLQRYGFRVVGSKPPQPYCQIYGEILEMLDATDNPLKLLLFFDMIFSGIKVTGMFVIALLQVQRSAIPNPSLVIYLAVLVPNVLLFAFGHITQLESAATHCKDMEIITATQLIKTPTASERQRMREWLLVLEHRGARYRVLRALPLDARLVLRALGFITAQAFVFANTIINN